MNDGEWRFEQDADKRWRWAHLEGTHEATSDGAFDTYFECALDAIRHAIARTRAGEAS